MGRWKPEYFLSNMDEWHAFWIGWSIGICPWRPVFKMPMEYKNPMKDEYHYYIFGRAIGFICLLGIITAFVKLLGG